MERHSTRRFGQGEEENRGGSVGRDGGCGVHGGKKWEWLRGGSGGGRGDGFEHDDFLCFGLEVACRDARDLGAREDTAGKRNE